MSQTLQEADGTSSATDGTVTSIQAIQESGDTSPLVGQTVTTQGVVTAISAGSTKGFYLQNPTSDGDAATSDAVFVFTGSAPAGIAVGDLVEVSGTVQEFRPNGAAPGALSTTELSSVTARTVLSSGNALPDPVLIGAGALSVPNVDIPAANAFFERLEGMLVTVQDPLVVGPTNSFGEIFTVADNGADATGLNGRGDLLISGGAPSFGNTDTVGGDLNPERIQIDPGLGITLPSVSTGARLGPVTGVIGYDFGDYQVLAATAPSVVQPSPLTKDAASLTGDADHLLVGSYNAENLDPGDGAARFATIAGEITDKLNAPDIVALQEIQDNTGPASDGVTSAADTLQMIVDAMQGGAATILPPGLGLSINVPAGASAENYAFTTIDRGTNANLGLAGNAATAVFTDGGPVPSGAAHSEGDAFNVGKITVSPIDGNIAVASADAYDVLAQVVGTPYGATSSAPTTLAFTVSEDAYQGDAQFVTLVNGHQVGGVQTVTASHDAGQSQTITLLDFFDTDISQVAISFINDRYDGTVSTDRNLYVDSLTLNGSVYQGDDAINNAGSATATEAVLYNSGTLAFAAPGDALTAGGAQAAIALHAVSQSQDILPAAQV